MQRYSEISPEDAASAKAGNRFDVLGGGVLYAATELQGCFAETLSRFRPSPVILEKVSSDDGFMNAGTVPADWSSRRAKALIKCVSPLPFLDVENAATHAFLDRELAHDLVELGQSVPLDVAAARSSDRALTRRIASWAYIQTDESGAPAYSGIRYMSRLGNWERWAIFEGTELLIGPEQPITSGEEAMRSVCSTYGLTAF